MMHLKRPDNATHVAAVNGRRCHGIDSRQSLKQHIRATRCRHRRHFLAKAGLGRNLGHGPPFKQTPHVLSRAAHENWEPVSRVTVINCLRGLLQEERQAERFRWGNDVVEVVWHAATVRFRWLGGANIHSPVNLAAIGVDDLPGELQGKLYRDARLA